MKIVMLVSRVPYPLEKGDKLRAFHQLRHLAQRHEIHLFALNDAGEVRAILDWEICTLGDPVADLGTLLCYWAQRGDATEFLLGAAPTNAEGAHP